MIAPGVSMAIFWGSIAPHDMMKLSCVPSISSTMAHPGCHLVTTPCFSTRPPHSCNTHRSLLPLSPRPGNAPKFSGWIPAGNGLIFKELTCLIPKVARVEVFFNGILDFLIQIPFYPVPWAHLIELQLHHELNLEWIYTPWNKDVSKNWPKTNFGKTVVLMEKKYKSNISSRQCFNSTFLSASQLKIWVSPKTKVPSLLRTLLARGSIQHETTSWKWKIGGRNLAPKLVDCKQKQKWHKTQHFFI